MKDKELKYKAKQNYLNHPFIRWILSFMFGLFLTVVVMLFIILDNFGYLSILLFPLLILPFLFAVVLILSNIDNHPYINFSLFFKHFTLYFDRRYRSSFRFINSLMYTLLIMLAGEILFSFVGFLVISIIDYPVFIETITKIQTAIYDGSLSSFSSLEEFIADPYAFNLLQIFACVSSLPPFLISVLSLVFLLGKNSFIIYLKKDIKRFDPYHLSILFKQTLKNNKSFYKDFFYLNWPLFVLLLLGFVIGSVVGSFFTLDVLRLTIISSSSGLILMSFFLPFFFSNNEAIYLKHRKDFESANVILARQIVNQMQKNIKLNEQEKELLEKRLKEFEEKQKNENSSDNKDEEDE